jgi:sterol 14-demethylase
MGLLESITDRFAEQVSQRGIGIVVAASFAAFLVLAVVLNVLSQLLFKNPNEPPVVFHWFPIIGSSITYGIHPYKFFFENRKKVGCPFPGPSIEHALMYVVHSMAISSRLYCWGRRRRCIWDDRAMISSSMGS